MMNRTALILPSIIFSLFFPSVGFSKEELPTVPDPSGHKILYQDGVTVSIKLFNETYIERIPVYVVAGLPFPIRDLEVDRRDKLSATGIRIAGTKDGFLIPMKDSAVPINMGFGKNKEFLPSFFTHAINVTWQFPKVSLHFETKDNRYEIEEPGGTISFTKDGVPFRGVKVTPKK